MLNLHTPTIPPEPPLGVVVPGRSCTDCGAREIVAIEPGQTGESCDLFDLTPGYPARCWCVACWPFLRRTMA